MSSATLDILIENALQRSKNLTERLGRMGQTGEVSPLASPKQIELKEAVEALTGALEALQATGQKPESRDETLTAKRRAYQSLFDFAMDGCLITNVEGVIQEVNHAAATLLNESRDSLTGKLLAQFLAGDEQLIFQTYLGQLKEQGQGRKKSWEVRVQPTGRADFAATLAGAAIGDETGRPATLLWELRDITERKQMEDDLQESRRHLQALFEYTQDAILVADNEARYIDVNPAASALLGYTRETFLKMSLWDLTPRLGRKAGRRLWQEFLTAGSMAGEYTLQARDGTQVVVDFRAVANIAPGVHLSVLRDITKRKQAETEIINQRDRAKALTARLAETQEIERQALARELHDQVGQYLTGLDLNLNIIQGQLATVSTSTRELIQLRLDDSLSLVEEIADRVRDLMNELVPPVLDDYGLIAALQWYGSKFASRAGFTFIVQGQEPVPRLPAAIEQALFRITQEALTNVAKHAQAGAVTLTLDTANSIARLVIADDGIGFAPDDVSQDSPGRGWGLMMMAERARGVGGRCHIESTPGEGTEVIVEVSRTKEV